MIRKFFTLLIVCSIVSCTSITGSTEPEVENQDFKSIEVFFSDPSADINRNYNQGPEIELVKAIKSARLSIDIAIYNMNLWNVRDALIEAYDRGIRIRIVTESENLLDEVPQQLVNAGIEIKGDRRESLMHNKFLIIDRQEVWTGSMNLTVGSSYYDHNNLIHIRSQEIATNYLIEFNEMFESDMFGDDIVPSTPYPIVEIDGKVVETYFSPDDSVSEHIVDVISSAQQNIVFMAYSFTSDDIGDAIIWKYFDGVSVAGIMDEGQALGNMGSEYEKFFYAGIDVKLTSSSRLMHHKVLIIDQKIVITGSYNFSLSAEFKNDENIIIIHDAEIAGLFIEEFNKLNGEPILN